MTVGPGQPADAFFLDAEPGQRFCLFHPPAVPCRGAVLYIHPFAEELNRSRRMAALQARDLAARGYGVLQIDLHGCGDSSGDFGDARWATWKRDVVLAASWLWDRLGQPITLWGLRLGALLAIDCVTEVRHPLRSIMLWQPVLNGTNYVTQFLRLRVAGAMLDAGTPTTTGFLRQALRDGQTVEVAGYDLSPALAGAIDTLDGAQAMMPICRVDWCEVLTAPDASLPVSTLRVSAEWQRRGVDLHVHPLPGPAFWLTSEITVSPTWLDATSAILCGDGDGN